MQCEPVKPDEQRKVYLEIGESITTRVKIKVCDLCNCEIEDTGLCSYQCRFDGSFVSSRNGLVTTRIYERTMKLVQEIKG